MIIPFDIKYEEDIKNLLLELGKYLESIDKEGYNITSINYKDEYYKKTTQEINENEGMMHLYVEDGKAIGLVVGLINNDEIDTYDFKAPRRGRITELVVSASSRKSGIGTKLLHSMEDYLYSKDCKKILIAAFGYNENAIKFYNKNGYHIRMNDMIN